MNICYAKGDGIGPEIMDVVLDILKESTSGLLFHEIEIGEKAYLSGYESGISTNAWSTLKDYPVFLKAPITTPQGGGYKSLNVNIRKSFGLYANVRPCQSYHPYIATKHPVMDVVIIRENEEDLYAGIEYYSNQNDVVAHKIITRESSEKIIRYAFEYAKANKRKKVTCFTKDNILKLSDGMFRKVFEEVSKEYMEIENEHWIIDIGSAKLADSPDAFDVIVLPNLYGDILSDVAAQIAGSVGMAGSANIGPSFAMFEAIHGSAPRRAGQNLANPSALLKGAVMMLQHIGMGHEALTVENAWLRTIEDGMHTYDVFKDGISKEKVGTKEFGKAIMDRLGTKPNILSEAKLSSEFVIPNPGDKLYADVNYKGVDIDLYNPDNDIHKVLERVSHIKGAELIAVSKKGLHLWPNKQTDQDMNGHIKLRFVVSDTIDSVVPILWTALSQAYIITSLNKLAYINNKPAHFKF
jgi:isocitrate dehydrogenase